MLRSKAFGTLELKNTGSFPGSKIRLCGRRLWACENWRNPTAIFLSLEAAIAKVCVLEVYPPLQGGMGIFIGFLGEETPESIR